MAAGIVYYRRQGTTFAGRWSDASQHGALADELVRDVEPGATTGEWPVEVFLAAGPSIFTGTLSSAPLGECLQLTWRGKLSSGKDAVFTGIGYAIDPDLICATFEMQA
jgi:hypothetical protein